MWVFVNFFQFSFMLLWFILPGIFAGFVLPRNIVYRFMNGAWCGWAAKVAGAKIVVKGNMPDKSKSFMILSNHQSYLDIFVLNLALKRPLHFIAKKELTKIPFLGAIMKKTECVLVSRGYGKESRKTYEQAIAHIKKGLDIVVFPEGTRSKDGSLGVLRKGAFVMAIDAGVPILPVAIHGAGTCWPRNNFSFRPGVVTAMVGAPIDTSGYTRHTVSDLMETFEKELRKLLKSES